MIQYIKHYKYLCQYQLSAMFVAIFSRYMMRTSKIKPNQLDFLDLLRTPTDSSIPITKQQKQKINQEIDKKMQQLQDTGLSRQQILLSKSQKGIPLSIDPFFQFLKENKLAREVYLKKSDRFSVQKVIDIALRQDIGPDASYSRTRDTGYINQKGRAQLMGDLAQKQINAFDPKSYYANEQTNVPKLYDELKPHQPLRHIYKPISRYQKIKTHMRRLKKYDIHWRNVQLLRQFLTPIGNIKNRMANCLSAADQKKVTMAIKASRHAAAIPHYGRILPPNRRNITNLEDQVKQLGLQNINLQTGQLYYSRSRSMDSMEAQLQRKSDIDNRYQQLLKTQNKYTLWVDEVEQPVEPSVTNSQKYARFLKDIDNQQKKRQKKVQQNIRLFTLRSTGLSDSQYSRIEPQETEEGQQSFKLRKQELKKKINKNVFLFSDILLQEKTL